MAFVNVDFNIGEAGGELRRAAEQIARDYINEQQRLYQTVVGAAYNRVLPQMQAVLRANLDRAIATATEYAYPPLRQPLENAVGQEGFIRVYGNITYVDIEFDTARYLGTENDFWDGIVAARDALGVSGKGTLAQRAAFWRNKVYTPFIEGGDEDEDADLYVNTIAARLNQWGGLAPYWLFLEYGNQDGEGAFPRNSATYWLTNSREDLRRIMQESVQSVEREMGSEINTELLNFLADPSSGQPRDIFDIFFVEGQRYHLYITPTRRLGLAQRIS